MENKIVVSMTSFNLLQPIFVFNSSNKVIKKTESNMKDLKETLFLLAEEYNVSTIDLVGNVGFNKKIKEEIEKDLVVKYDNKKELKVNLVSSTR